jgi:hypothetical protein
MVPVMQSSLFKRENYEDRFLRRRNRPSVGPDLVKTVAVNAERLNLSTVWAPEHVVLLDKHISKYPYSKGEFPLISKALRIIGGVERP